MRKIGVETLAGLGDYAHSLPDRLKPRLRLVGILILFFVRGPLCYTTSMDQRTLRILEFDKIRARLADQTSFSLGRERALALQPTDDIREAQTWQAETREARRLLDEKSDVHLGGVHDLRPLAEQATLGSTLLPADLLSIRSTLCARARFSGCWRASTSSSPRLPMWQRALRCPAT
jgi:hypothetical protein